MGRYGRYIEMPELPGAGATCKDANGMVLAIASICRFLAYSLLGGRCQCQRAPSSPLNARASELRIDHAVKDRAVGGIDGHDDLVGCG